MNTPKQSASFGAREMYNLRYAPNNGQDSSYEQSYNDRTIPREKHAIILSALRVADYIISGHIKGPLRILDFGCGDGRYRKAAYKIAQLLEPHGVQVEWVAYDVSDVGLQSFQRKLKEDGFNDEHKRSNLKVCFVVGSDKPEDIEKNKAAIGNVHVSAAIFGVISHIPGRANRVDNLKMLKNITSSEMIITSPGWRILSKELMHHDALRAKGTPYKLANEKGDLYYIAKGGTENFYHVYKQKHEFIGELAEAGLKGDISIDKIGHETTLTSKYDTWLGNIDEKLCYFANHYLPESVNELIAGYYMAKVFDVEKGKLPLKENGLAKDYASSLMLENQVKTRLG